MDNITNNSGSVTQNSQTPITGTPPVMPGATPPNNNQEVDNKSPVGPIVGVIIIVLVIVLGGLYVYGNRLSDKMSQEAPIENTPTESVDSTSKLEQQGSTDNLSEINADLNSSNYDNLNAEMTNINGELSAE